MGRPERQYFSVCMINRSDAARAYYLPFPSAVFILASESLFIASGFLIPPAIPFTPFPSLFFWADLMD